MPRIEFRFCVLLRACCGPLLCVLPKIDIVLCQVEELADDLVKATLLVDDKWLLAMDGEPGCTAAAHLFQVGSIR
jgi:hypothetical protein